MIKVAVVDDEEYSAINCRNIISSARIPDIQVDIFNDGKHFGKVVFENKERFDIIILDIDMPEITGFDIAKRLREDNPDVIIMFYTAHEQYVFKSFEFQPFRYIRKESAEEELTFAFNQAIEKITSRNEQIITVKTEHEISIIEIKKIEIIEHYRNYVEIYINNSISYRVRNTLKEMLSEINDNNFVYLNKGTVVNLRYVKSVTPTNVILKSGRVIPISRRRYSEVKNSFYKYIGDNI